MSKQPELFQPKAPTAYSPLCIVGSNIELRHDWSIRRPVRCLRCGCEMPTKSVDEKAEKPQIHHVD